MSRVWKLDLDSSLKLTLLGFADHANDAGVCYPSVERIAWKSGTSRRTVQRHVRKLEEMGLMEQLSEGGGRGNPARYHIRPEKGDRLTPFRDEKGVTVSKKGVTDDVKGDTSDARTISNHQGTNGGRTPAREKSSYPTCGTCGAITMRGNRCPNCDGPALAEEDEEVA